MRTFEELANPWVMGLGVYEPGRPIEEVARELGFDDADEIVKVASNENPLGPSPLAVKAMRRSLSKMHRYPDGGSYYLKEALAQALRVKPGQILPGNGSNELIELIGRVFLGAETEVVVADYAFIVYRLVAGACRAGVVSVPMKNFTHDLDAMCRSVTPKTRVLFVSNPNNPTGTMVDQAAIDRLVSQAPDHVVVCFDEAYLELLPPERQPDTLKFVREGRKVIVLRTFSKTYGLAGLRLGYAVAPESCIRLLDKMRQPFNANAMAQAAAVAALKDAAHVRRTRETIRKGLAYLVKRFDRLGLPYVPTAANFILVDVGKGREVFDALQRQGVIVRPMDGYGLPQYIRVTVGTPTENRMVIGALETVLGARHQTG